MTPKDVLKMAREGGQDIDLRFIDPPVSGSTYPSRCPTERASSKTAGLDGSLDPRFQTSDIRLLLIRTGTAR